MSDVCSGSTPILEAHNLTVRFGGIAALSDVSFDMPRQSIVGLVGPNGAGKSTLFAVLSGLLRPDAGRVTLDGVDVTASTPQSRARRGLARTFQQPELFFGFSVRDHVLLGDRVRHSPRRLVGDTFLGGGHRRQDPNENERVEAILELLGLTHISSREVAGLPLGTSRLVEIARALATCPSILLLDEPMSGLSTGEAQGLAAGLRHIATELGVAILLVEHDVPMVMRLCSKIVVLDFGRVIASGPASVIREDPAVLDAYLGDAGSRITESTGQ